MHFCLDFEWNMNNERARTVAHTWNKNERLLYRDAYVSAGRTAGAQRAEKKKLREKV